MVILHLLLFLDMTDNLKVTFDLDWPLFLSSHTNNTENQLNHR